MYTEAYSGAMRDYMLFLISFLIYQEVEVKRLKVFLNFTLLLQF